MTSEESFLILDNKASSNPTILKESRILHRREKSINRIESEEVVPNVCVVIYMTQMSLK